MFAGLVEHERPSYMDVADGGRCFYFKLTHLGMSQLQIAWALHSPVAVGAVRPGVALPDRTTFEMLLLLEEETSS